MLRFTELSLFYSLFLFLRNIQLLKVVTKCKMRYSVLLVAMESVYCMSISVHAHGEAIVGHTPWISAEWRGEIVL